MSIQTFTAETLSEITVLVPTNSPDRAGTVDGGTDAWLDVVVVALVLVLFLTPHQISIWMTVSLCLHQIKRER